MSIAPDYGLHVWCIRSQGLKGKGGVDHGYPCAFGWGSKQRDLIGSLCTWAELPIIKAPSLFVNDLVDGADGNLVTLCQYAHIGVT
jgi:hypothetical protein